MRAVVVAAFILVGCGSTTADVARATLTATAYGVVEADKTFAEGYRHASEATRASSTTQLDKDAKMADWDSAADELERVLSDVYYGLTLAEIALDTYVAADDATAWQEALGCLAEDLRRLTKVLEERDAAIPKMLREVLAHAEGLGCQ